MSSSATVRDHSTSRRLLASISALALGTSLGLTAGAGAAFAAPGDESHATGTFFSGSLLAGLDPVQLAALATAEASNDGTQPTQIDQDDLDATVLQALTIDIGGGVQVPVALADSGGLSAYARAEADGSSVGASGLVSDGGAIGVGAVDPADEPSDLTLDLTDTLGSSFTGEFSDLDLQFGAVSARAESIAGGTPFGEYEITGGTLVATSTTLAGTSALIDLAVDDLEAAIAALEGPDGDIVQAIEAAAGILGIVDADATSTATVDVDFAAALAAVNFGDRSAGGVTINPTTGVITVDLAAINGGSLNGLPANTNILTAAQLVAITNQVDALLDDLALEVQTAITDALAAATVTADVDLTIDLGGGPIPLADVAVAGTIADLEAGTATVGVVATGAVPLGAFTDTVVEAAVAAAVDVVADPLTGDLADLTAALQTDVVVPVITALGPALDALADALLITVNNQEPFPAVAGALFTETALRVQLLPQGGGEPITSLLVLDVAQATVGPNVVDAAPVITGMTPVEGPETGGTSVTITGTGFVGSTGVTFDGILGTGFTVDSDTQITVVTPPHAPETVDVLILHPSGPSDPGDFTYLPLFTVTEIDPDFGPEAGNTVVEITGACFTGAIGVLFDGILGTNFVVNSDTSITVTTPAGIPGFVDVTILASGGCGGPQVVPDGFEYIDADAPEALSLTPDSGPQTGGTLVTVSGTGFTGATGVTFDGTPGTSFTVVDDTTITVVTPAHPVGIAEVRVQHPDGPSAPLEFEFLPATSVGGISIITGPAAGGTTVTITGTCFTGATSVMFGTTPAASFVVLSDTVITAVTPAGTGTVDVTVVGAGTCGVGTLANAFTYVPASAAALAITGAVVGPLLTVALLLIALGLGLAYARRRSAGLS